MSNLAILSEPVLDLDPSKEPTRYGRPISLHTEVVQSRWKWIADLTRTLDEMERELFDFKYGRVSYLPLMHVEFPLLQALIAFWNTDFHCFTFEVGDIAPTLGEYAALLGFSSKRGMRYYQPRPERVSRKQLADWLEWEEKNLNAVCKSYNQIEGIEVGHFEHYYKKLVEREGKNSDRAKRWKLVLLAIGIYGLVLLPRRSNFIPINVLELLYQVENEDVNPAMPILAETYAALTLNALNRSPHLTCSTHLLHIWAVSQLFKKESLPALAQRSVYSGVISIFCNFTTPQKTHGQWRNELLCLKDINFRPPWYTRLGEPYELKLVNRGYLVLMGLWHLVGYAPSILARQFCDKQGDPHLNSCDYLQPYNIEEHWPLVARIITEWQNELLMGKSGKGVNPPLPIYHHWRSSDGTGRFKAPVGWFSNKKEKAKQPIEVPGKKSTVKLQEHIIVDLSKEIEALQLESAQWKKKWEEAQQKNSSFAERIVTQNKVIDALHKELSQVSRDNKKKMQQRKNADAYALKKISKLEAEIKGLQKDHVKESRKWEQDHGTMKKEIEKWKRLAQDESDARAIIQNELVRMVNECNNLYTEYKTKSETMVRKGKELLWIVDEAQQQLWSTGITAVANGNEDIANQLKQTYQLLASCRGDHMGECSYVRVEGSLPEVSSPTKQQHSMPMQGGPINDDLAIGKEGSQEDPMVEDDNVLTQINEEPGDFEEIQ